MTQAKTLRTRSYRLTDAFSRWWNRHVKEIVVRTKPGQQVGPLPWFFSQRLEETIVAKPGVGYNHEIRLGKFHSGLDMLAFKVDRLALECGFLFFTFCFW